MKSSVTQILKRIHIQKSAYWEKARQKTSLALFKLSAHRVPAYRSFLKHNRITPGQVKIADDLDGVPAVNKDNYLRKYEWEKLLPPAAFARESLVLTSTSGSTGRPFYFPRNGVLDHQSAVYHQIFLENSTLDKSRSTLVIICFGMGVWIGGVITYEAFKTISENGFPLTILTPGVNKHEIYEALKNIGPKYEQIILCGYPPFMKDVVDEAKLNGVNWHDFKNVKMVFAAESFSEKFRDYICRKVGIKDCYRDTMNIYGSADLGTMAIETPIAILARRLALKHKKIYRQLFTEATRLPTFAQFIPSFINFEIKNGSIYCTGDNVLPLVRYEIGDNGSTLTYDAVIKIFAEAGIDLKAEAAKLGFAETIAELPFVAVYERTDLSTKLYGAIIYPEYIKAGLQNEQLEKYVTGKFTMFTKHDKRQDEYLEINIELRPGITESQWLQSEVEKSLYKSLIDFSAEYKYLSGSLSERIKPRVIFWPYENPTYFKAGTKQKWVQK